MFRRLRDRMNDAVSSAASSLSNTGSSDDRVSELAAMGFREAEARHALRVADGDMAQATEWLLNNGSPLGTVGNPMTISEPGPGPGLATTTTVTSTSQEDSELQRAIQASLQTQTQTQTQPNTNKTTNKTTNKQRRQQSAASRNAGLAASSRIENRSNNSKQSLANTHPKVQMPKRLSQHDQEDIIMRCTSRVAPYSLAVDTLLRSLKTIQANPSNRKYHTVDTTTAMFQRSLNAPGVLDFLKAVNFHPNYNNQKTLTLTHFDAAAFYLGISALEQVQQSSPEYTKDKTLRLFQKDLSSALSGTGNVDKEMSARRDFLSKLPSEPIKGGSQITVEYGVTLNNANTDANSNTNTYTYTNDKAPQSLTKITRGFDHDDTLGDVVHWLGGQASAIPEKLEKGEWHLVDRNRQGAEEDYNFHRLDLDDLRDRTLQYVGCWPSGRLAIVPKLTL